MSTPGPSYEAHIKRCEALSALGRPAEHYDEAKAAIGLDPARADAWFEACRALLSLNRVEEALEHAMQGLSRSPRWGWGHRLRSLALSRLNRHAEALDAVDEALRIAPNDEHGMRRRARVLWELKRHDDAMQQIYAATQHDPEDVEAWCLISDWSIIRKDIPEGLRTAEQAIALDPLDLFALHCLGDAREKSDDHKGALEAYQRAIVTHPVKAEFAKTRFVALVDGHFRRRADTRRGCGCFVASLLIVPVFGALKGTVECLQHGPILGALVLGQLGALLLMLAGLALIVAITANKRVLEKVMPGGWALYDKLKAQAAEKKKAKEKATAAGS